MAVPAPRLLHPVSLIATWFGSGLLPRVPGTWGSLAALPFAWLLVALGDWQLLAAAAFVLFCVGVPVSDRYARQMEVKDPGRVVVDEVVGQWLAILPVAHDIGLYAVAFVAFRFFDIVKLWPANWFDRRLRGGLGIMADDVPAGVYAAVVAAAVLHFAA